jgi:1-acyl-sn-glycerol-3-phosphate acyltransferase
MAYPALFILCRKITVNKPELLKEKGPLLLASNHPNYLLDAIILDTIFSCPIYSLARGDVFKNKFIRKILLALKILPVYRTSEGVENLSENYKTFDGCMSIFKKNGVILIFSEGKCINEWHLRPLKKGTARLAFKAWEQGIPLKVLPVGLNYNSFRLSGKNIVVNLGEVYTQKDLPAEGTDGFKNQFFNNKLSSELSRLVYEIEEKDIPQKQKLLVTNISAFKKAFLFIPAMAGWIIHFPLYLPAKRASIKYFLHTDHYDSAVFALLFLSYPFYLLMMTAIAYYFTGSWWVLTLFAILPLCARATIQLKPQLDKPALNK